MHTRASRKQPSPLLTAELKRTFVVSTVPREHGRSHRATGAEVSPEQSVIKRNSMLRETTEFAVEFFLLGGSRNGLLFICTRD